MILERKSVVSNASRNIRFFKNRLLISKSFLARKFKRLTVTVKWSGGRSRTGRIVCWSKGSHRFSRRLISVNYNYRSISFGIVLSFFLIPYRNKFVSLLLTSNGSWMYIQNSEILPIFSLFYYKDVHAPKRRFKNPIIFTLNHVKRSRKLCLVELLPGLGAQYARSPGTFAKLIKNDLIKHVSLLLLPSGVKKIFSVHSMCFKGQVNLKYHYRRRNTKSGFWRGFGFKSITRGVAMNPIDHPNGGSTSSLRYPRTPWGTTTKFK